MKINKYLIEDNGGVVKITYDNNTKIVYDYPPKYSRDFDDPGLEGAQGLFEEIKNKLKSFGIDLNGTVLDPYGQNDGELIMRFRPNPWVLDILIKAIGHNKELFKEATNSDSQVFMNFMKDTVENYKNKNPFKMEDQHLNWSKCDVEVKNIGDNEKALVIDLVFQIRPN